jgi:enoyl-CoA hydratase/carnithine racemase
MAVTRGPENKDAAEGGPPVGVGVFGQVAELALAGGPINLVTKELLRSLHRALKRLADEAGLRCVIVHGGQGRAFCAGSDIKEFASIRDNASEEKILFEDMVVRQLARLPVPTIAALDGPALGGGLELALACDLRVARKGLPLGLTESRLGGLAGSGSVRLTRLVGPSRAKELLFTGETISSDRAFEWGLVNRLVDTGTALDGARELARTICRRGPLSNRHAKQLVDAAQDHPLDACLTLSTVAQQEIFASDDLHEGVAAFFGKREPDFKGR